MLIFVLYEPRKMTKFTDRIISLSSFPSPFSWHSSFSAASSSRPALREMHLVVSPSPAAAVDIQGTGEGKGHCLLESLLLPRWVPLQDLLHEVCHTLRNRHLPSYHSVHQTAKGRHGRKLLRKREGGTFPCVTMCWMTRDQKVFHHG